LEIPGFVNTGDEYVDELADLIDTEDDAGREHFATPSTESAPDVRRRTTPGVGLTLGTNHDAMGSKSKGKKPVASALHRWTRGLNATEMLLDDHKEPLTLHPNNDDDDTGSATERNGYETDSAHDDSTCATPSIDDATPTPSVTSREQSIVLDVTGVPEVVELPCGEPATRANRVLRPRSAAKQPQSAAEIFSSRKRRRSNEDDEPVAERPTLESVLRDVHKAQESRAYEDPVHDGPSRRTRHVAKHLVGYSINPVHQLEQLYALCRNYMASCQRILEQPTLNDLSQGIGSESFGRYAMELHNDLQNGEFALYPNLANNSMESLCELASHPDLEARAAEAEGILHELEPRLLTVYGRRPRLRVEAFSIRGMSSSLARLDWA